MLWRSQGERLYSVLIYVATGALGSALQSYSITINVNNGQASNSTRVLQTVYLAPWYQ
jgi:hypothetical protein